MPVTAGIRLALVVGTDAHEGPVYVVGEDALYFTTVPRPRAGGPRVDIRRLALDGDRFPLEPGRITTVRADANAANGMTLAPDGRLLVCEQGSMTRPAAGLSAFARSSSTSAVSEIDSSSLSMLSPLSADTLT